MPSSVDKAIIRGHVTGGIRFFSTNSNGEIDGIVATVLFDHLAKEKASPAPAADAGGSSSSEEYTTIQAANNTTTRYHKRIKTIDKDGNDVTDSAGSGGGASGSTDVGEIIVNTLSKADRMTIKSNRKNYCHLFYRAGYNVAGSAEEIDVHQFGKISSDIGLDVGPDAVAPMTLTVTGKTATKDAAMLDAAVAYAPPAITPFDGVSPDDDITHAPLLEADVTEFLKGEQIWY